MNLFKWFKAPPPVDTAPEPAPSPKRDSGMTIADWLESLPPEPDKYRRTLTNIPPKMPFARDSGAMAMDAGPGGGGFPYFGYLNQTGAGSAFGLFFPGYPYLAELAQRSEYRQPTETTSKELTRKWIEFKTTGKEIDRTDAIQAITKRFEELKIQSLFRRACDYDGFYGVGHIQVNIKGQEGADLELPLTLDEKMIPKGSLLGFQAIEPVWVTPLAWNSIDATKPDFYVPSAWQVIGQRVDATRMRQILSRPVPQILRPAYNFGGISLSQLIEPYVDRWLRTVSGVNRLINNFSIINLSTDMSAVLEGGSSKDLLKRMRLFLQNRDNQGLFMSDKNLEELKQLTVSLAGLAELQAQAQEHMAAPTHLPLVVLTGITPSGLNASSDSELEVWHDWAHSQQEASVRDPLTWVFHLVQLDLFGKIDPDISFDFVPLKALSGEAASRVFKTKADAGVAYIEADVITPQEERERLANDPDSGYINLNANVVVDNDLDDDDDEPKNDDEPTGAEDAAVIHYEQRSGACACGASSASSNKTREPEHVTCKRCLAMPDLELAYSGGRHKR